MAAPSVLDTFTSHEFLRGLSQRHLLLLASGARPFTAEPGKYLARTGQTANAFYLIQAGEIALEIHSADGTARIETIGRGEVVGWSWLVPPHTWKFDCRAVEAVRGLEFDAEWLREKCEEDHELGYQLLKHLLAVVARRLAATRLQLHSCPK